MDLIHFVLNQWDKLVWLLNHCFHSQLPNSINTRICLRLQHFLSLYSLFVLLEQKNYTGCHILAGWCYRWSPQNDVHSGQNDFNGIENQTCLSFWHKIYYDARWTCTAILGRVKWYRKVPSPPSKQGCGRMKTKTRHILDLGGRGGPNFPFILFNHFHPKGFPIDK